MLALQFDLLLVQKVIFSLFEYRVNYKDIHKSVKKTSFFGIAFKIALYDLSAAKMLIKKDRKFHLCYNCFMED
jgi:hypothetical protein